MDMLSIAVQNLTSAPVLAFALGLLATAIRSDLRLPEPIYQAISIYLLLGIGIKGGVALSEVSIAEVGLPILGTLILGVTVPALAFASLQLLKRLSNVDRGAIAAHYGSTSLVTFTAAIIFYESVAVSVEGYLTTLLAILEIPGIIVGLLLATRGLKRSVPWSESIREILAGRSIFLLAGGLAIGFLTGTTGFARIEEFFVVLFPGVLTLFLLELGIVAGRRLSDLKKSGFGLVAFALLFPMVSGFLGVVVGQVTGLSVGGAATLGVLSASASYIAAPAAVRLALPEASPGIYLTASLGITFPLNLTLGIPIMLQISNYLESVGL